MSASTPASPSPGPTGTRSHRHHHNSLSQTLWSQRVPLRITHASDPSNPFITSLPRFSYLSLLLPRLAAFFPESNIGPSAATPSPPANNPTAPNTTATPPHPAAQTPVAVASFHHEGVPLRNNLPLGLLLDLYQPASLPWRLTVTDGTAWAAADSFLNAAKEADFIRHGTAKRIMGLSKDDTDGLWHAVRDNDHAAFAPINARLLNAPSALRSVPLRVYVPGASGGDPPGAGDGTVAHAPADSAPDSAAAAGTFKVVQSLVAPRGPSTRQPQLLGQALRSLLPSLFPSSRDPVLANAVLHGAPVPFDAPVEDLMREAAYPDGWLYLTVVVL